MVIAEHLELRIDVGVGDFLDGFFYRQALVIAEFDFGAGRELHFEHEIFAVLVGDDLVINVVDGRKFFFLERVVGGVLNENLGGLVHKRLFTDVLFDDLHRRLALSETGDADSIGEIFSRGLFGVGELIGFDLDCQLHLVLIQHFFSDVHVKIKPPESQSVCLTRL